jgi:hypothetical protein
MTPPPDPAMEGYVHEEEGRGGKPSYPTQDDKMDGAYLSRMDLRPAVTRQERSRPNVRLTVTRGRRG